ncbi:MAG TPA: pitrilysin family protein [Terriglobia bacterium]
MRVVIIRNPLAPVVTVEENYLVGADETPAGFPGMAHAQEHMAFRGCEGVSADQTSAIYAQLGGLNNADTQQNITQYFATVPAADLDIALRMDAACMQHIEDADTEWDQERGAIEQEVARDLSNPTYKFITRLNEDLFPGSPYAHDALGTRDSFDATTGAMLKKFARDWYAPNNGLLVVVGDLDPQAALAQVKDFYSSIPRRPIPSRQPIGLKPIKSETFTLDSNLPYVLAFIAYRMPGTHGTDYAATRVLSDVLASQRADLYALVPQGKALAAEFGLAETYPLASVAYALTALPAGGDGPASVAEVKKILAGYADHGVPAELVDAAKRSEIANAEFERNSIPGLASVWSDALAAEGRNSPDADVAAIRKVSLADVNRVAKRYLREDNSVVGILKPVPSGGPVASKGFGGDEKLTSTPSKPVDLPSWAAGRLAAVEVPKAEPKPADMKLANGLRLIVKTDKTSPTITVLGNVRHEPNLETPAGKDGEDDVLEDLFSYGTKTLDRLAFQKALDDIAANETAGFNFSVRTLKNDFSRGVELLADNELNPALPADAFDIVKQQTAEFVKGNLESPGYRARRAVIDGLLPAGDAGLREVTPKTIGNITLDDLKQYHAATIRPDLTTIVVIGDVSPDEARTVIDKWFGSWKAPGNAPDVVLPAVPVNKVSAVNVPDPSELQDNVTLAEQVEMNRYNPDYYALDLANHVLGGGFYATRLYHDLRQVTGYVYTVDVRFEATRSRATYSVTYACDPKNSSKAAALIARDLADMQKTDVTPAELQQAKALLLRQIPLRESSEDSVAGGLLARAQMDLPLDEPTRAASRYFDLTAEQVRAAFQKWIRPDGFIQVVRGPAQQ